MSEFENKMWTMKAHYIFRQVAGQVLESLILVDRLLWLRGYCENCKIYKRAQKIIAKRQRREEKELAARQKRQAEDEEQIKYLQEYNRKKREGKK